ncbi:hypothetical protein J7K74_03025 [Candidatus Woesearchaeota archaeon]|nr:hypothetical protein [Candidatus Woesearchaeota archaeon]
MNKPISIRIPEQMYQALLEIVERESYKDVSELLRTIIRKQSLELLSMPRKKRIDLELIKQLEEMLKELKKGVELNG